MMRILLVLCLFISCVYCFEEGGVFGKLKSGFKLAGKLLGLDRASGVAELVSEAFGKSTKKDDQGSKNIFSGFFRIFGLDTKKIGAIAVNAIIFVAQLVRFTLNTFTIYVLGLFRMTFITLLISVW